LRELRVTLGHLPSLLIQIVGRLLALLGCELVELLCELVELLSRLLNTRTLRRLPPRKALQIACQLFERGTPCVGIWVDALLQLVFARRKIGQCLLAATTVFAQLALKLGELLVERRALLGCKRLILGDLLAQLLRLVGSLLECLLHCGALLQHTVLRVRQQCRGQADCQWN